MSDSIRNTKASCKIPHWQQREITACNTTFMFITQHRKKGVHKKYIKRENRKLFLFSWSRDLSGEERLNSCLRMEELLCEHLEKSIHRTTERLIPTDTNDFHPSHMINPRKMFDSHALQNNVQSSAHWRQNSQKIFHHCV